jgi:uncharacterized protein (TIGR03000 family)
MVRRWFSITAVLAVAALMVAADASQGQERRLGRRLRARRDGNVTTVQTTTEAGMPADMETGGRRANYPPETPRMSGRARSVLLEVRVPASAEIWIEGTKTLQTGAVRQFVSPPIEPGRNYSYKIEAKWMDQGSERTQSRTLVVRPGELKRVDLTKMAEDKQ